MNLRPQSVDSWDGGLTDGLKKAEEGERIGKILKFHIFFFPTDRLQRNPLWKIRFPRNQLTVAWIRKKMQIDVEVDPAPTKDYITRNLQMQNKFRVCNFRLSNRQMVLHVAPKEGSLTVGVVV